MRARAGEGLKWLVNAVKVFSDDCILWPFGVDSGGRGLINNYDGKSERAYAVALMLTNRPRPSAPNDNALHTCPGGDNPLCVNPSHLRWGATKDNGSDRTERLSGKRGSSRNDAKLTEEQVTAIREERLWGYTQGEQAAHYGVSQPAISDVHTGRRNMWAHVPRTKEGCEL